MDAYVYQAALWCEDCAARITYDLAITPGAESEDSDEMPQGPYPDGGGESDTPEHCDGCGVMLGNPVATTNDEQPDTEQGKLKGEE